MLILYIPDIMEGINMKYRILKNANGTVQAKKRIFGFVWVWIRYIRNLQLGNDKYIAIFTSVSDAKKKITERYKAKKHAKEWAQKDKQWTIVEKFEL